MNPKIIDYNFLDEEVPLGNEGQFIVTIAMGLDRILRAKLFVGDQGLETDELMLTVGDQPEKVIQGRVHEHVPEICELLKEIFQRANQAG